MGDTAFEISAVLVDRGSYHEIMLPEAFDPEQMEGVPLTINFDRPIGRVTHAEVTDEHGLRVEAELDKPVDPLVSALLKLDEGDTSHE